MKSCLVQSDRQLLMNISKGYLYKTHATTFLTLKAEHMFARNDN